MPDAEQVFPDRATTHYNLIVPETDWADWKDSIPRSIPLHERLHTLIQIDTTLAGEVDVASLTLLRMKFERIEERSKTARQSLAADDPQKARAELEQIAEIAGDVAD